MHRTEGRRPETCKREEGRGIVTKESERGEFALSGLAESVAQGEQLRSVDGGNPPRGRE